MMNGYISGRTTATVIGGEEAETLSGTVECGGGNGGLPAEGEGNRGGESEAEKR